MKLAFLRRHGGKLALLLALAVLCACLLHPNQALDPSWNGRPLSQWAFLVGTSNGVPASPQQKEEAARAIRTLGTNAIPSLLAWAGYEPTISKNAVISWISVRLPPKILVSSPVQRFLADARAGQLAQNAVEALAVLGPAAAPAVPELTRRARVPWSLTPSSRRACAMLALAKLGQPALPAMATNLSGPNPGDLWLMACIREMGTNATPLVPLIVKNLDCTNSFDASLNAQLLGGIKLAPDLAVPALTRSLLDPRRDVRVEAPGAPMEFGGLAAPSLPYLTNLLTDTDPDVRRNAAQAIEVIVSKANRADASR